MDSFGNEPPKEKVKYYGRTCIVPWIGLSKDAA